FAFLCVVLVLAVLATPQRGQAQVLYGSILGDVTDKSGSRISNATVTIANRATNLTREARTDETGSYNVLTVQTGSYEMAVGAAGFKTFARKGVPVTLNNITRVDVTMEVGAVSETVTVTAETPLLQTDRAEVRAELPEKILKDLPVPLG